MFRMDDGDEGVKELVDHTLRYHKVSRESLKYIYKYKLIFIVDFMQDD